jgi:hypothetical protein
MHAGAASGEKIELRAIPEISAEKIAADISSAAPRTIMFAAPV